MESDVKDLVQGYFNNPVGFRRDFAGGGTPLGSGSSILDGPLDRMPLFVRQVEERRFDVAREEILQGIAALDSAVTTPRVWVDLVSQGLRIELRERDGAATSFAFGSDRVRPGMGRALEVVARALVPLPNGVVIEGHTDASTYGSGRYTNWELSTDRANAARRVLVESGLAFERVIEVRGYADRHLLNPNDPMGAENRRVTILVPFAAIGGGESGQATPLGPGQSF